MPNAHALFRESAIQERAKDANYEPNSDDEEKRYAPFPIARQVEVPDYPLWHGQNRCIRDEVQDAGCNILRFHIQRTASNPLEPRIPYHFSRLTAKDLCESRYSIVQYVDPEKSLQYPVGCVAHAGRYENA